MTRMAIRTFLAASALLAAAGCGLKGDLETPAPLWGDPNREVEARALPGGDRQGDQVIFTRDDVDLFRDNPEDVDPFAEEDEKDASDDGTSTDGTSDGTSR